MDRLLTYIHNLIRFIYYYNIWSTNLECDLIFKKFDQVINESEQILVEQKVWIGYW
jgi:hypothetical protein